MPGPLDKYVQEIVDKPEYLTTENISSLRNSVPALAAITDTDIGDIDSNRPIDISLILKKQMMLHERLQSEALRSDDAGEMEKAMRSSKALIEMLAKHSERIGEQSRLIHIENAVVQTFAMDKDPQKLRIFRQNLAKNLSK